ncbi:MAG: hypothetical protein ACPG1A_10700, partial [Halioglobus sp.]
LDFYGFMAEPLVEIEKIYAGFDLELTSAVRQRMSEYLAVHRADQHGSHGYSFADTGLDLDEERERVLPYQRFFNTRCEVTA